MVERVVGDFGRCGILINNAGVNTRKLPEQLAERHQSRRARCFGREWRKFGPR
jgi:NAD(P)-dependent dehydrogenase (short-subunit alcohol dehydrogenase family)